MKVKLLKTNWPHERGEVIEVNNELGQRWLKIGLAEEVKKMKRQNKPSKPAPLEPKSVSPKSVIIEPEILPSMLTETDISDLEKLNIHKLRKLAQNLGITGAWSKSKVELAEMLKDQAGLAQALEELMKIADGEAE